MNNKQTFFAIVFLMALLVASSFLGSLFPASPKDQASAQVAVVDRHLIGYAWSSNIGWIDFGNKPGDSFGVTINEDGEFSGHAWANPRDDLAGTNNIGWLSFNPVSSESPAPAGPQESARMDNDGNIFGWARFCSGAPTAPCTGNEDSNPNADGWDGWVKMSGTSPLYGVHRVTNQDNHEGLEGYAWGGETIGWVNFDPWFTGGGGGGGNGSSENYSGECNPLRQVCIEDANSDSLVVTCHPQDYNVRLPDGEGEAANVTWTATVVQGTEPFTYDWSGNPSPVPSDGGEQAQSFYTSTGDQSVTVTVTDSATTTRTAFANCHVNIYSDETPPPPGNGSGSLSVVDGMGVIYISEQATGHPASTIVNLTTPWAQLENIQPDSVISGLRIDNIISTKTSETLDSIVTAAAVRDDVPYLVYSPQCLLVIADPGATPGEDLFRPCSNFSSLSEGLSPGQRAYLRVQIPTYLQDVADNSPYVIRVTGTTPNGAEPPVPTDVEADVVFKYLVGTYTPQ